MYSPKLGWKRVRGTRVLWMAIALVVVGQIAITYLPPMQGVFETESIPLRDALLILAAGVVLFVIIELEKRLRLRLSAAVRAPVGVAGEDTTPMRY
jgi:magnesium-transporting ATPase (P-type)